MRVPESLRVEWGHEPGWLAELPSRAEACAKRWGLVLEEPIDTPRSFVVPAGEVVLKLNAPSHVEADHEADALARWEGRGAARLVDRDDDRRALLLERCRPGTPLRDAGVDEVEVVSLLLPHLSLRLTGAHPFRRVVDEAERWLEAVPRRRQLGGRPFERALLDRALDVLRTVPAGDAFLVNQDLHGGNVLRAEREPWLVIDPKPLAGEREVDAVGLLRNAAVEPEGGAAAVRRWLDALASLGYDRDRACGWGVAHALAWGWDERRGWSPRAIDAARTIASA